MKLRVTAVAVLVALAVGAQAQTQQEPAMVAVLRAGAEQGDAEAQLFLGDLYGAGRGVPQDEGAAYTWFSLAASVASGGDRERYVKRRDRAAERLTPDQLADARRRVREWQAAHPREPYRSFRYLTTYLQIRP